MTSYEKGRKFEYEVKQLFERHGWFCIRSAGSKKIDLVCIKNGRVLLIECKRSWGEYTGETRKLAEKAEKIGFPIILIYRNLKGLSAIRITGKTVVSVDFGKILEETKDK